MTSSSHDEIEAKQPPISTSQLHNDSSSAPSHQNVASSHVADTSISTESQLVPKQRRLRAQFRPREPSSASQSSSSKARANPLPVRTLSVADEIRLLESVRSSLPSNYNFEILKTVQRILAVNAQRVALQMPEGLLAYSCLITDLIYEFTRADCIILGDVTYGACCVDDFTAKALNCDMLVHYGHSCLIPVDVTSATLPLFTPAASSAASSATSPFTVMYVFVDIALDCQHLVETIRHNFDVSTRMLLCSTIQFAASLQLILPQLLPSYSHLQIPQAKPLSRGEVLGCTSPLIDSNSCDIVVFVADGRFHLESMMIQNPELTYYQYDPYSRRLSKEQYDHQSMHDLRRLAIQQATQAKHWGLILGTLGRQGNPHLLERLQHALQERGITYSILLMSEISPAKLAMLQEIDCCVQIACPRLSIDWGHQYSIPLLNTYEAEVALQRLNWQTVYPMDYYANRGGVWSNYHRKQEQLRQKTVPRSIAAVEYESSA